MFSQAKLAIIAVQEDDGNVESVLVLIPLLILFLSVLQVGSAVLVHGDLLNRLQGEVSRAALLQSFSKISNLDNPAAFNEPPSNSNFSSSSASSNVSTSSNASSSSSSTNSSGSQKLAGSTSLSTREFELPGGGHLLISTRQSDLIPISPIAVGHTRFRTTAVAIDENQ